MKNPLAVIALAMLLFVPAAARAEDEPNIKRFDPGSYVTGPKFKGKQLKNKVIVVEYWGITCGPCLKAIPHTTDLAKTYGHDKLVIIANQAWSASDRQTKEVWNKYAKNNMVMVTNGGEMPGFKPTSFPRAVIFDHNLKPIWQGHPGSMDEAIKNAVANLPQADDDEKEDAVEQSAVGVDSWTLARCVGPFVR